MKYNYKPSLKELRFSLKYRSKEYFLENILHGVPYFVDPKRPKWERITWFFLTLASVIATAVIIVIIWHKFQTEPTITGLDIMTEHINIKFPQIFICFEWTQMNHSYLHQDELHLYEQLYNWYKRKNIDFETFPFYTKKTNFRSTFETMAPNCDDVISNCAYRGNKQLCSNLFTKVLNSAGACCKLNHLEHLKATDVAMSLQFETRSSSYPWRLYLKQHIDSSPKPDERPIVTAYFPVEIEFITDITYTTPDIRYLTLHQRECYYKYEGVSTNDCEINCFMEKLFSRCNCLPWFSLYADRPKCSLLKYPCLYNSSIDIDECDCWLPCNHTSYSVRGIQKSNSNVNRVILKNWPAALYKREMRFGYMDLLVSFGGVASLFLGYSILTTVELGYYFSLRTYCGAVIQASRKKYNIKTIHIVGKLPSKVDTNVHPGYYQYLD
ncbi:sodium channel protein Nach [Colletes latitarsis]|uniref:sodium channel protein Nach n=1 Tax=Colletes latitarsis TaxID=2605962 RepID=UPI004035FD99